MSSVSRVNSRRSQMSDVVQLVFRNMPGVPAAPNPPAPSFQAEASNPDLYQLSSGFSAVYFHSVRPNRASGKMIFFGNWKVPPRLADSITSPQWRDVHT